MVVGSGLAGWFPLFSRNSFSQSGAGARGMAGCAGTIVMFLLLFVGGGRSFGQTNGAGERASAVKILPRAATDAVSSTAALSGPWNKLSRQMEGMVRAGLAVEKWCAGHKGLPETLDQLVKTEGYIDAVPQDLYARGRPLSYRLAAGKRLGIISSYGPDGDDDNGVSIPVYRFDSPESIPDGDIVYQVHVWDSREEVIPSPEFTSQPLLDVLLDIKEQDGRDNAMIHYVEAEKLWPGQSEMYDFDVIPTVLEKGWDEGMTELHEYLAKWQPMFKRIRQGTQVGYARNIGVTRGTGTFTQNLMAGLSAAKMLCVEARYFESRGMYQDALDSSLTALTIGGDYGSPGSTLIHSLISMGMQGVALESIYGLVTTDNLDRPALDRLGARLWEIEKTEVPIADVFRNERAATVWALERDDQNPKLQREMQKRRAQLSPELRHLVDDNLQEHDCMNRDLKEIWEFLIASAEAPYWELDSETHQRKRAALVESVHPLLKEFSHHEEVGVRYRVMMAKLRLTRIVAALAEYKLDHGGFPNQLCDLAVEYLDSVPIDPFSGKEFSALYSVGPDRKDDGGKVQYDATNGTVSRGDVFF
jgi:hypothetical protein